MLTTQHRIPAKTSVISKIEITENKLIDWFQVNHMKINWEKCHLISSSKESITAKIGDSYIKSSKAETLLGITVDSSSHLSNQSIYSSVMTCFPSLLKETTFLFSYISRLMSTTTWDCLVFLNVYITYLVVSTIQHTWWFQQCNILGAFTNITRLVVSTI